MSGIETAESRAQKALADHFAAGDATLPLKTAIAQAIREAEDAALKRAKNIAQNEADFAARHQRPGGGLSEGTVTANAIVLELERLQNDLRSSRGAKT